jgi:hypothetical protein
MELMIEEESPIEISRVDHLAEVTTDLLGE